MGWVSARFAPSLAVFHEPSSQGNLTQCYPCEAEWLPSSQPWCRDIPYACRALGFRLNGNRCLKSLWFPSLTSGHLRCFLCVPHLDLRLFLVCLAAACIVSTRAFSSADYEAEIDFLAQLGPRLTRSPQHNALIEPIEDKLRGIGIPVQSDLYTFDYMQPPSSPILKINGEVINISSLYSYSGSTGATNK